MEQDATTQIKKVKTAAEWSVQLEKTVQTIRGSLGDLATWVQQVDEVRRSLIHLHKKSEKLGTSEPRLATLMTALRGAKENKDKNYNVVLDTFARLFPLQTKVPRPVDNTRSPPKDKQPPPLPNLRPSSGAPSGQVVQHPPGPTYVTPDGSVWRAIGFVPTSQPIPSQPHVARHVDFAEPPKRSKTTTARPTSAPDKKAPSKSKVAPSTSKTSAPAVTQKAGPLPPKKLRPTDAPKFGPPRFKKQAAAPRRVEALPESSEKDGLESESEASAAAVMRARVKMEQNDEALNRALHMPGHDNDFEPDGQHKLRGWVDQQEGEEDEEEMVVDVKAEEAGDGWDDEEEEDKQQGATEFEEDQTAAQEERPSRRLTRSSTRKGRRGPISVPLITSDMDDTEYVDTSPEKPRRRRRTGDERATSVVEFCHQTEDVRPVGPNNPKCTKCIDAGVVCEYVSKTDINQCYRCWRRKIGCSVAAAKRLRKQTEDRANKAAAVEAKAKARARSKSAAIARKSPRPARAPKAYKAQWNQKKNRAAEAATNKPRNLNQVDDAVPRLVKTVAGYEAFGVLQRLADLEKKFGAMSETVTRLESENKTLRTVVKQTQIKVVTQLERSALFELGKTQAAATHDGQQDSYYLGRAPNRAAMTMSEHLQRQKEADRQATSAALKKLKAARKERASATSIMPTVDPTAPAAQHCILPAVPHQSADAPPTPPPHGAPDESFEDLLMDHAPPSDLFLPAVSPSTSGVPHNPASPPTAAAGLTPVAGTGTLDNRPGPPSSTSHIEGQEAPAAEADDEQKLHTKDNTGAHPDAAGMDEEEQREMEDDPDADGNDANVDEQEQPTRIVDPPLATTPAPPADGRPFPNFKDVPALSPAAANALPRPPSPNRPSATDDTPGRHLSPITEEVAGIMAMAEDELTSSPLSSPVCSPPPVALARRLSPTSTVIHQQPITPTPKKRKRGQSDMETPANKKPKAEATRSSTRLKAASRAGSVGR